MPITAKEIAKGAKFDCYLCNPYESSRTGSELPVPYKSIETEFSLKHSCIMYGQSTYLSKVRAERTSYRTPRYSQNEGNCKELLLLVMFKFCSEYFCLYFE